MLCLSLIHIYYSEAAAWYGALNYATLTHDDALRAELIKRFDPLLPGGAEVARIPKRHHVDDEIFGIVPIEIGIETKDQSYIANGLQFADDQWSKPQPDGLSDESRYWIDDMYMLTILQVQAYRATGDKKYIDRAAKEIVSYLNKLQQKLSLIHICNSGYDMLRGPRFQDWDMNLQKNILFRERYNIQLRADSFNVFNHPNLGTPNANISSGNVGTITGVSGTPTYEARTVEFAAKFSF